MPSRIAAAVLCLLAATPAFAGEGRPRLVAGGMNVAQPEVTTELFSKGGFSAGAATDAASAAERGHERMALGGYAAYAFQDLKLSSSLKGDAFTSGASLSAAYSGFAADSLAAVRLGYDWGHTQAFSVNPAQAGLSAFTNGYDPARNVGDLSLTLSFTRDVTPSLSFGGFAAATHKDDSGNGLPENGLHFGAGLGVKF